MISGTKTEDNLTRRLAARPKPAATRNSSGHAT
jgi:hypothetical protein